MAIENHKHNGTDAPQIEYIDLSILPETNIADVTGTAGASYTSNEQTIINDLKTKLNQVFDILQAKNLMK